MAVLTPADLDTLRFNTAKEFEFARPEGVNWTKARINAAMQAIEDTFSGGAIQNALNTAINTATAPHVFTAAEKRAMVKYWLRNRFDRGN